MDKELYVKQLELYQEIMDRTGINIVTCGNCGCTILHKLDDEEVACSSCGFKSDPADFPDILYESKLEDDS